MAPVVAHVQVEHTQIKLELLFLAAQFVQEEHFLLLVQESALNAQQILGVSKDLLHAKVSFKYSLFILTKQPKSIFKFRLQLPKWTL